MESQDSSGSSNAELTAAGEAQQKTHNGSSGANGGHSSSVDSASSPSHINEDGTPVNFPTNNRNTRDVSEVAEGKLVSVGNVASEGPPPVPVSEIVAGEEGHSVAGADTDNQKSEGGDLSAKRPPVDGPGFDGQVNTGISQEDATEENSPGHSDKTALADQASTDKEISQEGGGSVDGPAKANKADLEGQGFTGSEVSQDQEDATEEDSADHSAKPKEVVLEEKTSTGTGVSQEDATEGGSVDVSNKASVDLQRSHVDAQSAPKAAGSSKCEEDKLVSANSTARSVAESPLGEMTAKGGGDSTSDTSDEKFKNDGLAGKRARVDGTALEGHTTAVTDISQEESAENVSFGCPAKPKDDREDKEALAVKSWLVNMGLSRYFDLFVEEGFDDLEAAMNIEEEDLDEMGVLRGHKRKILGRKQGELVLSHDSAENQDGKLVIKKWLISAGCGHYVERFLEEGFDDYEALSQVQKGDLDLMEVKRGHKRKILLRLSQSSSIRSSESESVAGSTMKASSDKPAYLSQNSYKGKTDEELSFEKGQMVIILEEYPDGRCRGLLNGKEGVFPKEALFSDPDSETNPRTQDVSASYSSEKTSEKQKGKEKSDSDNSELSKHYLSKAGPSFPASESETSAAKDTTASSASDETALLKSKARISVPTKENKNSTPTMESSALGDSHCKTLKEIAGSVGNETTGLLSEPISSFELSPSTAEGHTDENASKTLDAISIVPKEESYAKKKANERQPATASSHVVRPPLDSFHQIDPNAQESKEYSDSAGPQNSVKTVVTPSQEVPKTEAKRQGGSSSAELKRKSTSEKEDETGEGKGLESSTDENSDYELAPEIPYRTPADSTAASAAEKSLVLGVNVNFRALLHPEWNLKENQWLCIRFGNEELGNFIWNVIKMEATKTLSTKWGKMLQLSGSFILPPHLSVLVIQYKYVVVTGKKEKKRNEDEFEYLCDARHHGGSVNRVLFLPTELRASKDGYFVKYDDVVRRKPGMLGSVKFWNSQFSYVDGREVAIRAMLPKWTGFYCKDSRDVNPFHMPAFKAMAELHAVITQLQNLSITEDKDGLPHRWDPGVDIPRILSSILKPKITELRKLKQRDNETATERVISAIAIAMVVKRYKLGLKPDQLSLTDFKALASALALPADFGTRSCPCLNSIAEHFSDSKDILEAVYGVCSQLCNKQYPAAEWILAVPLVHFLADKNEPFKLPRHVDWKKNDWWSLGKLGTDARRFQIKTNTSLLDMKESLLPLIALDPLLLRVILYFSEIKDVMVWIGAASPASEGVVAIAKKAEMLGFGSGSPNPAFISLLRECIPPLTALVLETSTDRFLDDAFYSVKTGIQASVHLLDLLYKRLVSRRELDIVCAAVRILFYYFNVLNGIRSVGFSDPRDEGAVTRSKSAELQWDVNMLDIAVQIVGKWIDSTSVSSSRTTATICSDIEVWSDMFNTDVLIPDMAERWCGSLVRQLTMKLDRIRGNLLLETISSMRNKRVHPMIEKCFASASDAAVEEIIASGKKDLEPVFNSLLVAARGKSKAAAGKSLQRLKDLLLRNSPSNDDPESWLRSLLNWSLWRAYLKHSDELFSNEGKDSNILRILAKAEGIVRDVVDKLAAGDVTVWQFRLWTENKTKILDILGDSKRFKTTLQVTAATAFEKRSEEWQRFKEERKLVSNFVSVCQTLGKIALDESAHASLDVNSSPIRSLVERKEDGTISVIHFSLPVEIRQFMTRLDEVQPSVIFQQLWLDQGDRVNEERRGDEEIGALPMGLSELVQLVIEPVFSTWERICKIVRTGEIVLGDVKGLFRNVLDSPEKLKTELRLMSLGSPEKGGDWIKQRANEIVLYNIINEAVDAARTLLRVSSQLGLSEFPAVAEICRQNSPEFHQQPLSVMTPDMLSAGKFLSYMKKNQIKCLQQFADCGDLIKWVRDEIKEWKELETFVELAGTRSSAEGDFEAVKVAHLRAACAGFAPLLFDLEENVKLDQFLKACRTVFEKLERDDQIPQKWFDTQKYLRDFKVMKEVLGSVEVSSFSQVEVILSRGRYTVGSRSDETPAEISDCIVLKIKPSPTEERNSPKKFSFSDLQDLQSKLILISGHSSERQSEVNVFVSTLESITRLAANSVALCRAGHVKYLSWRQTFDCVSPLKQSEEESDEKVTAGLNTLFAELEQVASEMESDLQLWKEKMFDVRSKYYYLNYFTTAQLLILVRHLGTLAHDKNSELPSHVYGLLECVKPNIISKDVSSAVRKVSSKTSSRRQTFQLLRPEFASQASLGGGGFPAADSLGGGLFSSGADLGFGGDDLGFASKSSGIDFLGFGKSNVSASIDIERTGGEEQLSPRGAVKIPIFNPDNDKYLSLETLGEVLQNLATSTSRPPSRSFPSDQLELGFPNLIVIPQAELIPTVLSLYMVDPLLPLPSSQEVLLCSPTTTLEDVCLFWRRAIKDPSRGRLFCLAGADRLSYEVSREAVDELNRFGQGLSGQRGENYRLVVVCSAENEDKSYIISALDHERRLPLPCPTPLEVQNYLKTQFQRGPAGLKLRTAAGTQWVPAASELDHEQSCVRVVYSTRAGVGKSLFINQMAEKIFDIPNNRQVRSFAAGIAEPVTRITVPIHELCIDINAILETLHPAFSLPDQTLSRLIHFDISSSVRRGLEEFLFNLLILGQIMDSKGFVWRRRLTDMYVLECTWAEDQNNLIKKSSAKDGLKRVPFECFLPAIRRGSPEEALDLLNRQRNPGIEDSALDGREFGNSNFQRAFQYLVRFVRSEDLNPFEFVTGSTEGTPPVCLGTLLENCGVLNPSWAIVRHFVNFLSSQLRDCERSDFINSKECQDDLPGFKNFVMKLMIRMSRDFSTPSLSADLARVEDLENLDQYRLRREWEQGAHPYLFFNEDRHTMTFVGLRITRDGQLVDSRTDAVLDDHIMARELSTALYTQGFRLQEDYEKWTKERKIEVLCSVMGLPYSGDPDPSYELTTDNVIKILAIHMRFRCGIPVVIMGETGCGKTRLIRYMCSLRARCAGVKNMLLMKVHGGITRKDIIERVDLARKRAKENAKIDVKTVLFFDEVNTTDAVGLIKEVMCDKRVNGHLIQGLGSDLHVIAACNPYRKHTDVMIKKLESAGLGYHVRTGDTEDRLGDIPLRQLVYRVHPLPESMKALVWDFGQLSPDAEKLYIRQIVSRFVLNGSLPNTAGLVEVVTEVFAASQMYMRGRADECSFVSLRDVERAMMVMVWFYKLDDVLGPFMQEQYDERNANAEEAGTLVPLDPLTRSLALALGVCYQARLQDRKPFRKAVIRHFEAPCDLNGSSTQIKRELEFCQTVFLNELVLPPKIGKNHALKENVFMMVVCIDLRIPLFLVGKPGSSKSLAKDVVKTAMRGDLSASPLYRRLKQVHMVSYQCSPLSTADGIISTFQQCQRMQQENDLERFVACVVLDEVGLAEDSPRLPLKALHPLLDDGTAGADDDEDAEGEAFNRVAFVGISNWALDPAKMNRGILVQREVPSSQELIVSAKGICSTHEGTQLLLQPFISGMANAYLEIYKHVESKEEKEFFGLRDFYSLVKMIFSFCQETKKTPTVSQMIHAIRRNFGGLENVNPVDIFMNHLDRFDGGNGTDDLALDSSPAGLIRANLNKTGQQSQNSEESRYLLLLTENYAALTIVRQRFLVGEQDPVIIFGSSFSKDQEYTQICRNINRVKVCMATGRTVVLLNLDKLYESLYDALNQYYVYHGGQRFVDLGLGSHRVKCQVHKNFRLILIADREAVYNDFPIPLINRMEKHFLAMSSILTRQQQRIVEDVNKRVHAFSEIDQPGSTRGEDQKRIFKSGDAFVGYHPDAAATVVLRMCRRIAMQEGRDELDTAKRDKNWEERIFDESCRAILQCATPDAVARLPASQVRDKASALWDVYFKEQCHSSLADYLFHQLGRGRGSLLFQVTTHSRLLSGNNVLEVEKRIGLPTEFISLQQFDTEQQFCSRVRKFFSRSRARENGGLLIVLCESGDVNGELVACARYLVQEQRDNALCSRNEDEMEPIIRHVVFVIHLPRVAGGVFVGFQGGAWTEVHIDDLRPANQSKQLSIMSVVGRNLSALLGFSADGDPDVEDMDVEPEAVPRAAQENAVLSVAVLFRSCVHAATSRLDDPAESPADSVNKRLSILLRLIPEDETSCTGVQRFYVELKRRAVKLLAEREERAGEENAREWVKNEALSHNSIQAGGTFRQSLWLKIVNVVTPILAELIAFIDVDSNLALLREAALDGSSWLSDLWLKVFSSRQLTPLHYKDFLSPTDQQPRQRVLVKGSGYQGHIFQAQFPFSRLIKEEVDTMTDEGNLLAGQVKERLLTTLQRLYNGSGIGKLVNSSEGLEGKGELAKSYLHDFIHMVHNPRSSEDFQLVFNAILSGFNELTAAFPSKDILTQVESAPMDVLTIPAIHATYRNIRSRLNRYSDLVNLNGNIVDMVHQQTGCAVAEEMSLDTVAYTLFLEQLQPKPNDLPFEKARVQWLQRVQKAKPFVEAWLALPVEEHLSVRTALHSEARIMWTRICTVRLYFEHTKCLAKSEFVVGAGERLWKSFQSHSPDFGTVETMDLTLQFLNETSRECARKMFGLDNRGDCLICEDIWKKPVQLPCQHIFCLKCIDRDRTCPVCRSEIPQQYRLQTSANLEKKASDFATFRSCCTALFMELVAVYTFNEHARTPPKSELVQLLMVLVAQQHTGKTVTRAFSPFESDAIDVTPTVRSFLLQLLLRHSGQEAARHVEAYFENARKAVIERAHGVVSQKNEEELGVIFVQCIEDSMTRAASLSDHARVNTAMRLLEYAAENLQENQYSLAYFRAVASARFGLCIAAEIILEMLDENEQLPEGAGAVLELSQQLCTAPYDQQILFFLLKQLVKHRGSDALSHLQNVYELGWLDELVRQHTDNDEQTIPDYCVVIGDNYKTVREAVARAILTGSALPINQALLGNDSTKAFYCLLALYREVTMRQASADVTRHVMGKTRDVLEESFRSLGGLPDWFSEIGICLIHNTLSRACLPPMIVSPGQSNHMRAAATIGLHILLTIETGVNNPLMKPLVYMLKEPERLAAGSYLPTMPDDNFSVVRGAARGDNGSGTKWHQCPNGHPYFIDMCGGAVTTGKCFCGARIGGVNYRLHDQNVVEERQSEAIETGHILGQPNTRSDSVAPERALSSSSCAFVRLLMHAALMWASCSENQQLVQSVSQIVKPGVAAAQLPQFLWDHFEKDLRAFAKAIGQATEDASVVIHQLLDHIVTQRQNVTAFRDGSLKSKQEREAWETDFCRFCIDPVFQMIGRNMRVWMDAVVNDERVGSNPLMRWLYELEAPPLAQSPSALWRFRARVTVEHLTMTLEQHYAGKPADQQPTVLCAFLKEERNLRALQYLPQILQLQSMLLEKYHRRLALHEAMNFSIKDFLGKLPDRERQEFSRLIDIFQRVWAHLGPEILSHGRLKPKKDEDRLLGITMDTPMAFLLPTTTGKGTCALSLVDYLINCVQNEFITTFRRLSEIQGKEPMIPMNEVTQAQLISYDVDRDLFPLVLSHCNYSLEVGKGSDITYDFVSLERQLVDRFLTGKPQIRFKVNQFAFSGGAYSIALFVRIEQKIPQEKLSAAVSRQIINELRDLTEVYSVLSVLDVLIGFIVSTGGDKEDSIHEYLHNILRMPNDNGLVSPKAQQFCRLKHVVSLWRLLTVEKGKRLVLNQRDPFEDFPRHFKEEMEENIRARLVKSLRAIDLDILMGELMELAWLELKNRVDTQGLEEYPIKDALGEFCHSKLKSLDDIPDEVELRHLLVCWETIVLCAASLETEQRSAINTKDLEEPIAAKEVKNLQKYVADLENQLVILSESCQRIESERDSFRDRLAYKETEAVRLEEVLVTREIEKNNLQESLSEKKNQLAILAASCRRIEDERDSLRDLLAAKESESARLRTRCHHAERERDEILLRFTEKEEESHQLRRLMDEEQVKTEGEKRRLNREIIGLDNVRREKDVVIQKLKQYDDLLQISEADVIMTEVELGRGAYGEVRIGQWRGCHVAVKTFYEDLVSEYYRKLLQQEMDICSRVRHPNLLAVCGVTIRQDGTPFRIITKLLEGSLLHVITAGLRDSPLTLRELIHLAFGFTSGIDYLHQLLPNAILHGDIRSTNILISAMMEAQIADFGTARFVNASLSAGVHSRDYLAPERFPPMNCEKTKKSDIYSLGVTLTELMTGEHPLVEKRFSQVLNVRHPDVKDLCQQMIAETPEERPSASDCLQHLELVRDYKSYKDCSPKRLVKGVRAVKGQPGSEHKVVLIRVDWGNEQ